MIVDMDMVGILLDNKQLLNQFKEFTQYTLVDNSIL